jgi:ABC-2 type transport system ATP-binding protein
LGYLAERAPLYGDLTARGFLKFLAGAHGMSASQTRWALDRVIEDARIEAVIDRSIDTLSKGYKRRVGLAGALMHDPPVLVLDEPTDGLDPNQKQAVRGLIDRMAEHKAILISTHQLDEVEAMCTRIVMIDAGKIVADETPTGLLRRLKTDSLEEAFISLTREESAG